MSTYTKDQFAADFKKAVLFCSNSTGNIISGRDAGKYQGPGRRGYMKLRIDTFQFPISDDHSDPLIIQYIRQRSDGVASGHRDNFNVLNRNKALPLCRRSISRNPQWETSLPKAKRLEVWQRFVQHIDQHQTHE